VLPLDWLAVASTVGVKVGTVWPMYKYGSDGISFAVFAPHGARWKMDFSDEFFSEMQLCQLK